MKQLVRWICLLAIVASMAACETTTPSSPPPAPTSGAYVAPDAYPPYPAR